MIVMGITFDLSTRVDLTNFLSRPRSMGSRVVVQSIYRATTTMV